MKRRVPRLDGTARRIGKGELIGLQVRISAAHDAGIVGLQGEIVDETLRTLTIRTGGPGSRRIRLSKVGTVFAVRAPLEKEWVDLDGGALEYRPADRTKKVRWPASVLRGRRASTTTGVERAGAGATPIGRGGTFYEPWTTKWDATSMRPPSPVVFAVPYEGPLWASRRGNAVMCAAFLMVAALFQVLDAAATWLGLQVGAAEANPVMRHVLAAPGPALFFFVKGAVATALAAWAVAIAWRRDASQGMMRGAEILACAFAVVVLVNLSILGRHVYGLTLL